VSDDEDEDAAAGRDDRGETSRDDGAHVDRGSPFDLDESPGDDGDAVDVNDGDPSDVDAGRDAPLSGLAGEVAERRDAAAEDAELSELFESVEVEEVDTETLWEEVMDEGTESQPGVGGVDAAERVETGPSATYEEYVVEKGQFCQRCPYFADPPAVGCTHEGTHVLEVVDFGHFRVRDCPMVTEDHLQDVE
jgi:hypothetical protein